MAFFTDSYTDRGNRLVSSEYARPRMMIIGVSEPGIVSVITWNVIP